MTDPAPEPDLNRLAAELVMGWYADEIGVYRFSLSPLDFRYAHDAGGNYLCTEESKERDDGGALWRPMHRWDHAGMLVKEMARKGYDVTIGWYHLLPVSPTEQKWCRFHWHDTEKGRQYVECEGDTLTVAITEAAVAAIRMEQQHGR